jgi:hypothetical protein
MYTDPNIPGMLEPELNTRMPRPARLTPMTQFTRLLGVVIWIGLTVLLLTLASRDINDLRALQANGRVMNATVIDKYYHSGKSTTYYLRYQYLVDSQAYSDTQKVSYSVYDETAIGAPMLITCLPSAPTTDRVGTVDKARVDKAVQNWVLGIGAACLVAAIVMAAVETGYRKQLFLLQEGVAAAGTIVSKSVQRRGRSTVYTVTYSFTAEGQPMWKSSSVSAAFESAVYPGAYVTVLYNPSNPQDCFPYKALRNATL